MTPATPREKALKDTIRYLEQRRSRGIKRLRLTGNREQGTGNKKEKESESVSRISHQHEKELKPQDKSSITHRPSSIVPKPPMRPEQLAEFKELRKKALACVKCSHLAAFRKQVVFGVGNPGAELMFVGEAPGADEDQQGEPFVGRAGQLLTKMIQAMGFQRPEVYIGNVLKCRPNVETSTGNRKPTPEEMAACAPWLKEQIRLIQPRVLVTLGDVAVKGLFPSFKEGISRLRGHWLEYEGIPLMPTFHPAYLLRNPAPAIKRQCWEDLLAALEKLGRPISEKQRNYFLSALPSHRQ